MLPLTRPLVCLDIESTGTSVTTDRIIELGLVRLDPDGTRTPLRWLLNPGCPIPPASTAVHKITDAEVAGQPGFVDVAEEVAVALMGVDLAGFNLRAFDLPMLRAEFERAGVAWPCPHARVVDAFVIFRERETRKLTDAVRFYCGRELEGAHSAVADADATLDVLLAQLERYPDLPRELGALDQASGGRRPDWATECGKIRWNSDGDAVFSFGKHKGQRLADVARAAPDFLRWVQRSDFPRDVQALCRDFLAGQRPRVPVPPPPPPAADIDLDDLPF